MIANKPGVLEIIMAHGKQGNMKEATTTIIILAFYFITRGARGRPRV